MEQVSSSPSTTSNVPHSYLPLTIGLHTWKSATKSIDVAKVIRGIKYMGSAILLCYSIAIVMTGYDEDKEVRGPGGKVLFWIFLIYLACIEGGQNALVGLSAADEDLIKETHSITYLSKALTQGNNLAKFIIGRQLIVVMVVFAINSVASINEGCSTAFHTSAIVSSIFCGSGLALIVVTLMMAQLSSQVVSSECMMDFINNYLFAVTAYIAVGIEMSGLLHSVHFVTSIFHYFQMVHDGKNPSLSQMIHDLKFDVETVLYWTRVLVSLLFLL